MLNELAKEIHQTAVEHGWWENPPSFGEVVALCHSELSEALEEYRAGRPVVWYACTECDSEKPCHPEDEYDCLNFGKEIDCEHRSQKPEGEAVEMIDCVIRVLDYLAYKGVDVDALMRKKMEYNKTRPYRHGGKIL